jgi:hypothetical protein
MADTEDLVNPDTDPSHGTDVMLYVTGRGARARWSHSTKSVFLRSITASRRDCAAHAHRLEAAAARAD